MNWVLIVVTAISNVVGSNVLTVGTGGEFADQYSCQQAERRMQDLAADAMRRVTGGSSVYLKTDCMPKGAPAPKP